MNILLIGNGAREHAIAGKIADSQRLTKLWIAPGNAGTDVFGENLSDLVIEDPDAVVQTASQLAIDLVIIGPEGPLSVGVADRLRDEGFSVFGPNARAAEIETSKAFANELMSKYGIDTADSKTFDSYKEAKAYVTDLAGPCVVKADGLAAGKGVTVCDSSAQALKAIDESMQLRNFGAAGDKIVIEERMYGWETSAHAFTDGITVRHMPFSCDHKPVFDNNVGPNTGGMGVYSPPPRLEPEIQGVIETQITETLVKALGTENRLYQGVIYPGIMLTASGPRVVEVNARFGDPETEVLLPRLKTDLIDIAVGVATSTLKDVEIEWSNQATVGVMLTSSGYPGHYEVGHQIYGLDDIDSNIDVFLSGANRDNNGHMITTGGRVLCVTASADTLEDARSLVYENIERITFEGAHFRKDIGSFVAKPE
jgi:phosphoribosylamine--glycine ligase